jgi:hypothetical protein
MRRPSPQSPTHRNPRRCQVAVAGLHSGSLGAALVGCASIVLSLLAVGVSAETLPPDAMPAAGATTERSRLVTPPVDMALPLTGMAEERSSIPGERWKVGPGVPDTAIADAISGRGGDTALVDALAGRGGDTALADALAGRGGDTALADALAGRGGDTTARRSAKGFQARSADLFRSDHPVEIGEQAMLLRLRLRARTREAMSVELRF